MREATVNVWDRCSKRWAGVSLKVHELVGIIPAARSMPTTTCPFSWYYGVVALTKTSGILSISSTYHLMTSSGSHALYEAHQQVSKVGEKALTESFLFARLVSEAITFAVVYLSRSGSAEGAR